MHGDITHRGWVKHISDIRSGDYAWFPPQPPGSLVIWGTELKKINRVIQGIYLLWTMTSKSLSRCLNLCVKVTSLRHSKGNIVILTKFSSLVSSEVVKMTTSSVARDLSSTNMTTYSVSAYYCRTRREFSQNDISKTSLVPQEICKPFELCPQQVQGPTQSLASVQVKW